jgi:5-methylcytosine-specific restriction protein A
MSGDRYQGQHEFKHLYNSMAWRRLRESILRQYPLCQQCLRASPSRITEANTVHHKVPHKGNHLLFLDPNNLEAVCAPCHSGEIQQGEVRGYSGRLGVNGWPVDINHPFNKV